MIYKNVPIIRQENSMSCWHACVRMIWGFKYKQSINPMQKEFNINTGISPAQFIQLAKTLEKKNGVSPGHGTNFDLKEMIMSLKIVPSTEFRALSDEENG
jgi:ABC-type bacteriocin/lantibiotic exporter with double-glycine peptidase domain